MTRTGNRPQTAGRDAATLEVVKNALDTVADEMALILVRTAHSPIVRDSMDFSTALCDAGGANIAQGLTTPMHLGSFWDAMSHLIGRFSGAIDPGDVFIGNDPYLAQGQHLPDIYVVKPVFAGTQRIGWAATIAHHVDVGGIVPGSNSIGATEIYQEGLRLPFVKWFRAGREDSQIREIIAANVRVPELVIGDLRAQVAACRAGEQGLQALAKTYGSDELARLQHELHEYAERLSRAAIARIPDGVYRARHFIDGLGTDPTPIVFQVAIRKSGDEVEVDWEGTSAQVEGGINAPLSFTKSNVYAALRSIMPVDMPNAHGYTRPIRVSAAAGLIVNCVLPAPCGARGITGYRIVDCVFGALAQALPDEIAADGAGGSTLPTFSGRGEQGPFVFSECVMGTWGATSGHDGQEGVPHMASNQSNIPIEQIEQSYPIRIERYGFVPDSGGAGRFRGGLSLVREYRVEADVLFSVRADKHAHRPFGLFGGRSGGAASNVLVKQDGEQPWPMLPLAPTRLRKGERFVHTMAGGGGFGTPGSRDPALVLEDVLEGKVTPRHALDVYGVVLVGAGEELCVDEAATQMKRSSLEQRTDESVALPAEYRV
ncbi:MAG: hydantoinase B/oxoprolinase family protein [Lautropia sp.]